MRHNTGQHKKRSHHRGKTREQPSKHLNQTPHTGHHVKDCQYEGQ